MRSTLGEISDIQGGYPFRGRIPEMVDGSTYAVQMKDVNTDGTVTWETVVRTEVSGRRESDWLRAGDVLFVTKGTRFFAVAISQVPGPAVCSPTFYLLRVKPVAGVVPEFVAWQINQQPAQRYLRRSAEGSNQLSIRRQILEAMPFAVPAIAQQQLALDIAKLALQERALHDRLLHNRDRQLRAIAKQLLDIN